MIRLKLNANSIHKSTNAGKMCDGMKSEENEMERKHTITNCTTANSETRT